MNRLILTLFLFISIKLVAQGNEFQMDGTVKSDSLPVENIHIVNNRTKIGAISNSKGEFNIYAKLKDTLTISGIQFYTVNLIITENELANKIIEIEMLQKINTLREIELNTHDLIGNLTLDSKNFVDTVQKISTEVLVFGDLFAGMPTNIVNKKISNWKLPDLTDPMIPIGGDLIGLANLVFSPLIKVISENIDKRKLEINKEREITVKKKNATDGLREKFGDLFFIKNLDISAEQIDAFINYCKSKGVIEAYLKNNEIELIDILILESKNFNQTILIKKSE